MKARRNAALRLGVVLVSSGLFVSCASSGGSSVSPNEGLTATDATRKTQQEVQSELMAFSDRFFAETLDHSTELEQVIETPEGRYTAAAARLVALMVTTDIAASPNPASAVLDMAVFVTLKRIVWEEYWIPEVYGHEVGSVLAGLTELEEDIWGIAGHVYTPEQLADLMDMIAAWREHHPDAVFVDFIRLAELGDSKQAESLIDAEKSGGLLAPIREANRTAVEMRLLAERLAFMATRMQLMLSLQVEMASAKLAYQPEVQQILEDSRTFAEVSDRAAEAFAALVADLPDERRAAIDQVMSGLNVQREQLLADLENGAEGLRPALLDIRQTLEIGREFAAVLDEAMRSTDQLFARAMAGNKDAARPFNILDYQATLAEATITAREIQTAIASIESLLESESIKRQMEPILDGAFIRGVALIIIFFVGLILVCFVVLALYRVMILRFSPGLGTRKKGER